LHEALHGARKISSPKNLNVFTTAASSSTTAATTCATRSGCALPASASPAAATWSGRALLASCTRRAIGNGGNALRTSCTSRGIRSGSALPASPLRFLGEQRCSPGVRRQKMTVPGVEVEQRFVSENCMPAVRTDEPGDDTQQSRLAGSVGPQHRDGFGRSEAEGNVEVARVQRGVECEGHAVGAGSAASARGRR